MRILAIDPGYKESAMLRLLTFTDIVKDASPYPIRIDAAQILPNDLVRNSLAFYDASQVDIIAIEDIVYMGMLPSLAVFDTAKFIGRLQERSPIEPMLVDRRKVRIHHCGSPRAKDANIRRALLDKYGEQGTKKSPGPTYGLKSHLWSAFAIATYISETA